MGNYVGKNHGRIVELTENYVSAIEIVANGPDEWLERPRKLQLRTADTKIKRSRTIELDRRRSSWILGISKKNSSPRSVRRCQDPCPPLCLSLRCSCRSL